MVRKASAPYMLVTASLIAAGYAVLTFLSSALGLAYGNIQFRLSEILNITAAFTPAAIPGLTVGCVLGNLASPFGIADVLFGSAATLLSSLSIYYVAHKLKCGKSTPYVSVIPPVVFNAVTVGLEIVWFVPSKSSVSAFLLTAAEVAIGEITVCAAGGIPLYYFLKNKLFH